MMGSWITAAITAGDLAGATVSDSSGITSIDLSDAGDEADALPALVVMVEACEVLVVAAHGTGMPSRCASATVYTAWMVSRAGVVTPGRDGRTRAAGEVTDDPTPGDTPFLCTEGARVVAPNTDGLTLATEGDSLDQTPDRTPSQDAGVPSHALL